MENEQLLDKKIEYMINMKVQKLSNALSEAQGQLKQMSEELLTVRKMVNRINMGVAQDPQTKLVQPTIQARLQQPQAEQKKEYTSADVSIEKMFYFGNK